MHGFQAGRHGLVVVVVVLSASKRKSKNKSKNMFSSSGFRVPGSVPASSMRIFRAVKLDVKRSTHVTGVAQRQSVYNIVGRILRPCIKVRKTDGYRLISGRSQDRNLSPVYHSICVVYRTTPDVKRSTLSAFHFLGS